MENDRKERFKSIVQLYFIIVTLINVATFVLGTIFRPEDRFGYDAFLSPLIYGLISLIPTLFINTKKERTLKQEIIKEVVQLACVEALLIVFGIGLSGLSKSNLSTVVGFAIAVFFVYVCTILISWFLDSKTARQMTEDLVLYQNRAE